MVRLAVASTAAAASRTVLRLPADVPTEPTVIPASSADSPEAHFAIQAGDEKIDMRLRVTDTASDDWVRVISASPGYVVEVTRDHSFMRSFAHLPTQEIEPILRLAAALAVAEVAARRAGVPNASMVRSQLNEALRGPLGTTTIDALGGS